MKKFKIVIWLLIIGFIGLFVYQNKDFFWATKAVFHLDLMAKAYATPQIPVVVVFIGFFVLGWLVAFLFALPGRLRNGKTIRILNEKIRGQSLDLTSMRSEIDALKTAPPSPPPLPEETTPPDQDPPVTPS